MSETSFMMKGSEVLATSYLCRNPNSPSISCDCAGVSEIPVLPDFPPCENKVSLWWVFLLIALFIMLMLGTGAAVYNRKYFWKLIPCLSTKEKKEEKYSVSMQSKEQP